MHVDVSVTATSDACWRRQHAQQLRQRESAARQFAAGVALYAADVFEHDAGMSVLVIGDSAFAHALASALQAPCQTPQQAPAAVSASLPKALVLAHSTDSASAARALDEDIVQTSACLALAEQHRLPVVFLSRLSAIGARQGLINEDNPTTAPFGTRAALDGAPALHAEIDDLVRATTFAQTRAHHGDADSARATRVREELLRRGGATRGRAFDEAYERQAAVDEDAAMHAALCERAQLHGFAVTTASQGYAFRGYTSALAERLVAQAAVPWCIVRLAAPAEGSFVQQLIDDAQAGVVRFAMPLDAHIEILPNDLRAAAVATATAALVASSMSCVVHVATSDRAPLTGDRLLDLVDLAMRRKKNGKPALARDLFAARVLGIDGERPALPTVARDAVNEARALVGFVAKNAQPVAAQLVDFLHVDNLKKDVQREFDKLPPRAMDSARAVVRAVDSLLSTETPDQRFCQEAPVFAPDVRFSQRGWRACVARAGSDFGVVDTSTLDWRRVLLHEVVPACVAARADRTSQRQKLQTPRYETLAHLVWEVGERFANRKALSMFQKQGSDPAVVDVSYHELLARARAVAARLVQAGLAPGDRVILSGHNQPAWGIAAFGVVLARGTLVPLDPNLEVPAVDNIVKKCRPTIAIVDRPARQRFGAALVDRTLDLAMVTVDGPPLAADAPLPLEEDVASILFTSGTTGEPKGVMLTHRNFCALLAGLQATFPTYPDDSMLSVLPLHHTFEFSCGLLMPLASGGRIFTPEALTGEAVLYALREGKITAVVGVPALWQLLERRITKTAQESGDFAKNVFDVALKANRAFGKRTGLSFGKVVLSPVHQQLGGHLRVIISGGSALPPSAHELFQGLGLPLAEGYGLTESAPVLTVAEGRMDLPAGTVGKPIPGVEIRLADVDPHTGIGEVWAKADNVMKGYFEDEAATRATLEDGWLKTGDLGKIDAHGVLRLVGRNKDVVVSSSGENIYLDDVEKKLEHIDGVVEFTLLGISDPRGGERLALLAVCDGDSAERKAQTLEAIKARVHKLPSFARPAVIELVEGPLPRTATRKVKRKELQKRVEAMLAERGTTTSDDAAPLLAVRNAIALVAGVDVKKVAGSTRMQEDLGYDSLMWVELQSNIEAALKGQSLVLAPEVLAQKEHVVDVENYVRTCLNTTERPAKRVDDNAPVAKEKPTLASLLLPVFKPAGRKAVEVAQREAYRSLFQAKVSGRAFIPYNRNTIVVANHTSHLDTGLVKFALGTYGKDLRPLAAKDYFFEGAALKVGFFEHFTNLVPIDRETGSGLAFEQARDVITAGHTVLIFPEGTRREDGTLGGFKPLVARLSLATNTDILPVWMDGNFAALPRGTVVPNLNARHLSAHIGPPLCTRDLARLLGHLPPVQAARTATEVIHRAVRALSEGQMLDLSRVPHIDALEQGVTHRPHESDTDVNTAVSNRGSV